MKQTNFDMWDVLVKSKHWLSFGMSALTTFYFARYVHGFPLCDSIRLMNMQLKELGYKYEGGPDCCKYRGKENISKMLTSH